MAQRRNILENRRTSRRGNPQVHTTQENKNSEHQFATENPPVVSQIPNRNPSRTAPLNIISHSVVNLDGTVTTTTNICEQDTNVRGKFY